jgi:hypothetical protein
MGGDFPLEKPAKAKREGQNGCTESGGDEELVAPANDGIEKGAEG